MTTDKITIPTRQRLRLATTPAVIDDSGKVLVAANDNFTVDPLTQAYVVRDSPVDRLLRSKKITPDQHAAATRFYEDYYNAGLAPLGAVDYGRAIVDGTPPAGHSDFMAGASERWNRACKAMSKRVLKVVDRVVLREIPVEMAGRDLGIENAPQARAVGLFALTEGLEVLVRHYEITT